MTQRTRKQFHASAELSFNRSEADNSFISRPVPDRPKNNWWSPLRRGLIIEPSAKHQQQMKQAVWLYLYCLLNADATDGTLFRRLSTIAHDTGIPKRTLRRWLSVLRDYGYLRAAYNGHFWQIAVTKWKPLGNRAGKKRGWLNRFKHQFFERKTY